MSEVRDKYKELKDVLLDDSVVESINTEEQMQAYYYLGCSQFHTNDNTDECEQKFKLSIAKATNSSRYKPLTRLAFASVGVLYSKRLNKKEMIIYVTILLSLLFIK